MFELDYSFFQPKYKLCLHGGEGIVYFKIMLRKKRGERIIINPKSKAQNPKLKNYQPVDEPKSQAQIPKPHFEFCALSVS
ncbi:MAG: hypothetical protein AB1298_07410 [Bacteroidota bacterium]